MISNHSISDLVSRIKNGYASQKTMIASPVSLTREAVLRILKSEGYILGYNQVENKVFNIHLKYQNMVPVINEIKVISKPGKRVYCSFSDIPLVKNGLGMLLISTSQGIITDYEARVKRVGGELILKIF